MSSLGSATTSCLSSTRISFLLQALESQKCSTLRCNFCGYSYSHQFHSYLQPMLILPFPAQEGRLLQIPGWVQDWNWEEGSSWPVPRGLQGQNLPAVSFLCIIPSAVLSGIAEQPALPYACCWSTAVIIYAVLWHPWNPLCSLLRKLPMLTWLPLTLSDLALPSTSPFSTTKFSTPLRG